MATRPGIHQDFRYENYSATIKKAIFSIANQFYITRSFKSVRIGNSDYYAILARPTDEFSVYVNADRELIVLFSDYNTFEIRTLEAFDEFYATVDSARVDKSLRFLVSSDNGIESIIRHYLSQTPEYPIIIPMTFTLIENSRQALLDATRRNYLLRDLFGYQNPLREETFFFGRQNVVNTVLDLAKSGQSSSLFGLRKSGKTSTIYAISRKSKAFGCVTSIIDCQNPSVHARDYRGLLILLLNEVRKTLGIGKAIDTLGDTPAKISENFAQFMKSLTGQAKGKILIIFDEIENISPNTAASRHWREGGDSLLFWQIIRSFIQSEASSKISICLVGTSPHLLELSHINGVANPMYLFSQKKFIPNLTFDETRNMIEKLGHFMGLTFSPDIIADIQKTYGGHPFFIRQACSTIHQISSTNRPVKVSQETLRIAKQQFSTQMIAYLSEILRNLNDFYPEEMTLLEDFLLKKNFDLLEFASEAPIYVDHLIGYGLIERSGAHFDIKFDAIRHAVELNKPHESLEKKWEEILRRRNSIENEIRRSIFYNSKFITLEDWVDILEKNLTLKRFSDLTSNEPAYLLSKETSPLYLTDLLMIMKDERILPYIEDRRSDLLKAINVVNKLRKDTHARDISNLEMTSVRQAFETLEGEFCGI
ncbi:ATP-binding protein [Ensifer soli]|uniref:hypothetical protein n=1 Tax=Ciceribacter sp. sgz301302 TaxID=3342379 RepID=UPI0035B8DA03